MSQRVTTEVVVNRARRAVWTLFNAPEHVVNYMFASGDWHCPSAENDLRVGGKLNFRMESIDGSFGFDFEGVYDAIEADSRLVYTMPDGRQVETTFADEGESTRVRTVFDPESQHSVEMQRDGWQAILENFKQYAESATE